MSLSWILTPCVQYTQDFNETLPHFVDHQIVGANDYFPGAWYSARPEQKWHDGQALYRLQNIIEQRSRRNRVAFFDVADDVGEVAGGFSCPTDAEHAHSFFAQSGRAPWRLPHRAAGAVICCRWLPVLWRGTSGRNRLPLRQCRIRKPMGRGLCSWVQNITKLRGSSCSLASGLDCRCIRVNECSSRARTADAMFGWLKPAAKTSSQTRPRRCGF